MRSTAASTGSGRGDPNDAGPAPAEPAAAPDPTLVRRVLEGDREAFSNLVRRHQPEMFRYARGLGLDYDPARDIVQEAFVTAYTKLGSCRDPHRFRQWLMRIVRNRCLDYHGDIRRKTAPLEVLDGAAAELEGPEGGEPDLRRDLEQAFARLSPRLRDAFLLKFQSGYTYDEMADLAGTSASAMKMRVQRARQELRRALGEDHGEPT